MIQTITDTGKRIRTASASSVGEVLGNRFASVGSTVAIGGSIAAVITNYWPPPEALHSHVVALVVFGWNTVVFIIAFFWRKYFGDNGE